MHYHPKAALTSGQRARVQHLHRAGMSQSALARQVGVHRHTIQRWIARPDTADRTGGLRTHGRRVVTDVYRDAVIAEWQAHPRHGPKRSAQDWRLRVPTANTATVWRILHAAGLTRRPPQKKRQRRPIPVGRHRVQLDIQELPAIRGSRGREDTIRLIHLRTRMKSAEIHPPGASRRSAGVLRRAIGRLPPFHLAGTDTAMGVTMAHAPHPERRTAFERTVADVGVRHWRITPRSPWQNRIIERSNRTDTAEWFHQQECSCSDHRRYGHR
jgi:transposase